MRKYESFPFAASPAGLAQQIQLCGLPKPEYEFVFHPARRWRFDIAWPFAKIACEYQGGLFVPKGGHQTVKGMRRDWEKFNEAQILGWTVLLFGPDETRTGNALLVIERTFDVWQKRACA
jgi:hypothetical protein